MNLEIITNEPALKHVKLSGRLDTRGVGAVETRFAAVLGVGARNVVVDFSGVEFLSSMGIRMLVTAARTCGRNGGKLVVLAPQPLVLEALETASLTDVMPVAASLDEALAAVGS